jgi:isocitrate dehydrogenase (NAD+)
MPTPTIVVLDGDQTGQELLLEALRVLEPDVDRPAARIRALRPLARERRATKNAIVHEAAPR